MPTESQSLSTAASAAGVAGRPELLAFFFLDCFCCCCQRQSALVWPAWPGTEHSACGLIEAEALRFLPTVGREVSTADLPPPLRLKALRVDAPSLGLPMTRAMCADWKTGPSRFGSYSGNG